MDDGLGAARLRVLKHKHEVLSGSTSSISYRVMGFDEKGEVVGGKHCIIEGFEQIADLSNHLVSFMDSGGLTSSQFPILHTFLLYNPELVLLISNGATYQSQLPEQLELCGLLKKPFVLILTHLDKIKVDDQNKIFNRISQQLSQVHNVENGFKAVLVDEKTDFKNTIIKLRENIIPVIFISSVTGKNLSLLKKLLFESKIKEDLLSEKVSVVLRKKHVLDGCVVVEGFVHSGTLRRGQFLLLGPLSSQTFQYF